MSPLWVRLLLVFLYLLLVVVVSGLLELFLWCQDINVSQPVAPLSLTVRQLKALLDARGVGYMGLVEKRELAELVQASGDVTLEEASSTPPSPQEERERVLGAPSPFLFTGGLHLWEEVEDCKDSVWLVQVVSAQGQREPLLDDLSWRRVVGALAPLGVRTGVFHCHLDHRLCKRKGWQHSQLVLALPRGTRAKDHVVLTSFTSHRSQAVIEWVRDQMSVRVLRVGSLQEVKSDWMNLRPQNNSGGSPNVPQVHMLFLTHLLHPPLFLAALSIKFTGRVKFGMYTVSSPEEESEVKKKVGVEHLPSYVVVTPGSVLLYGKRPGELLTMGATSLFLATLQPEANDVFLTSLLLVNVLACVELLFLDLRIAGGLWRHLVRCFGLLVAYNFWLFLAWLLLCGAAKFRPVVWTLDGLSAAMLAAGITTPAAFLRVVFLRVTAHPMLCGAAFLLHCAVGAWLYQRLRRLSPPTSSPHQEPWWDLFGEGESLLVGCLFRPVSPSSPPHPLQHPSLPHPSSPHLDLDLEEGLEMLIEHLAVPNLWLQPIVSSDYLKNLPTWRHRTCCACGGQDSRNEPLAKEHYNDADGEDSPSSSCESSSECLLCTCPEDKKSTAVILRSSDCAVCLEPYKQGVLLCGLPCGHVYHDACVKVWLGGGKNHHCPVCRWPAYKARPKAHAE